MKKILTASVVGASLTFSSIAMADGDLYLKGGLGLIMGKDVVSERFYSGSDYAEFDYDGDNSIGLNMGVGYKINETFSTELTLQHNTGYDASGDYKINVQTVAEYNSDPNLKAIGTSEISSTALMVSGIVDIASVANADWKLRPYAGLGLGFSKNTIGETKIVASDTGVTVAETNINANSDTEFAWKFIAGTTYPINDKLSFDASYQYSDYGQVETGKDFCSGGTCNNLPHGFKFDVKSHELMFALRYSL